MLGRMNYKVNKTIDLGEGPVNGQGVGQVSKMRLGFFPMSYNGCELIAIYNLLLLNGKRGHKLSAIAKEMYAPAWALCGVFGSNVYVLDLYFKRHGIPCEKTVSMKEFEKRLSEKGTGIVSMWNAHHPFKGIHTVCVEKTETGIRVYNRYNSKDYPYEYDCLEKLVDKPRFMCGYTLIKGDEK